MDYREWIEKNKEDLPEEIFKLSDESDLHYSAFLYYLYLGRGRSISRAYYLYAKDHNLIEEDVPYDRKSIHVSRRFRQYSIDHNWIKRADALDKWIDGKRLHQTIERQTLVEDHTWDDYLLLRKKLVETVSEVERRNLEEVDEEEGIVFSARALKDLALASKYISDVGRKAAGLPSTITNKRDNGTSDSSKLSADELQTMDVKAKKELEQWEKERTRDV